MEYKAMTGKTSGGKVKKADGFERKAAAHAYVMDRIGDWRGQIER